MTLEDATEAFGILGTMLTALQGSLASGSGAAGAAFRYAIGDLRATGLAQIQTGTLGAPLLNCFILAAPAGATVSSMEVVRLAMSAATPVSDAAIAVTNAGLRFALGAESRILAATSFPSSTDVLAAMTAIVAAFEAAQDYAADNHDPATYQTLTRLNAAVVRDLTTRAVALPKLVTYAYPTGLTSHALAYRLYGDAGRADELRAENGVIAPAFMPAYGTCLSE